MAKKTHIESIKRTSLEHPSISRLQELQVNFQSIGVFMPQSIEKQTSGAARNGEWT